MKVIRLLLIIGAILFGPSAFAAPPVGCIQDYQDSTCVVPLVHEYMQPRVCPDTPGMVTDARAQWIGSKWTEPACHLVQPPGCSTGQIQTAAPTWNGAQWVGLGCAPGDPPVQQGGGPVPINGGFVQVRQITMYIPRFGQGTGLDAHQGVWALYFTNAAGQFVYALPLSGPNHEIDPPPATALYLRIEVDPTSGLSISQVHNFLAMTEGDVNMNVPSVTTSTPNPDVPVCNMGISLDACLVTSLPDQPAIVQPLARDINNDN
jgi:hypothetical protein